MSALEKYTKSFIVLGAYYFTKWYKLQRIKEKL